MNKRIENTNEKIMNKKILLILFLLTVIGGVLRFLGCNWGITCSFQPDERHLVDPCIEMIRSGRLISDSFNYPGQFISKFTAIIITIWTKWNHLSIEDTAVQLECYFIFRRVIAFFGTLTISLAFWVGERIKKNSGIVLATFVTFFPEYIRLSKQVTGDVTSMFCVLLCVLVSSYYLEKQNTKYLVLMSATAAMGTMEKYHSAIACFYIGLIIIVTSKDVKSFFKRGILAFVSYIVAILVIAPNLILNVKMMLDGILHMAEYNESHSKIDVITEVWSYYGHISGISACILLLVGLYFVGRKFQKQYVLISIGFIKWFALCFLNRCFYRWGLELLFSLLILMTLGVCYLWEYRDSAKNVVNKGVRAIVMIMAISTVVCYGTEGLLVNVVALNGMNDTRNVSLSFCEENGIDMGTCLTQSYTTPWPVGLSIEPVTAGERQMLNEGLKYKHDTLYRRTDRVYAVLNLRNTDDRSEALKKSGLCIKQFDSICNDVFQDPLYSVDLNYSSFHNIKECFRMIKQVAAGGYMGPSQAFYNISSLPLLEEG